MYSKSFNEYFKDSTPFLSLNESVGILKHLTHLEELILTDKKIGFDIAIQFINELYSEFTGNSKTKVFTTVKYDGAPAIFCGYNPENNKFFVATKSLGALNPKVNYSIEDITRNHGDKPGLAEKLITALKYLPQVIKKNIYQGDFMFDKQTLYSINYEGEEMIAFKPNTIVYTVPKDSELGAKILNSEMGIIFHTRYTGPSLQKLQQEANVDVSEFNIPPNIFVDDAKFKDMSGVVTLTEDENKKISEQIQSCINTGKAIRWDNIPDSVYLSLKTFVNSLVRSNKFVLNPEQEYTNYINWLTEQANKDLANLKTDKGKEKKQNTFKLYLQEIEKNKIYILSLFNLTAKINEIKNVFIAKYNNAIKTKQFIVEPDGSLKVTAPEGYVAVDKSGNKVKLVDRLEFSRANFAVPKDKKFT
jgi:hypothetical protein